MFVEQIKINNSKFTCGIFKMKTLEHKSLSDIYYALALHCLKHTTCVFKFNIYYILFPYLQHFVFEACQDLTLVILMVAAAISLSLGMATEVSL